MGMATYTNDKEQLKTEFSGLKKNFEKIKSMYFSHKPDFDELSMGMSLDFEIAIEHGSTIIRVGSTIFGSRY